MECHECGSESVRPSGSRLDDFGLIEYFCLECNDYFLEEDEEKGEEEGADDNTTAQDLTTKQTGMSIKQLLEGLKIFGDEFLDPQWSIIEDGENLAIAVWDQKFQDGGKIVADEEKLNKLGWKYESFLGVWIS